MAQEEQFVEFINDRVDITATPTILSMAKEFFCEQVPPEEVYTLSQLEDAVNRLIRNPQQY